ncbi:helix-turn-helix transcriptional regulator [Nocardioides sp.]|uniref:helix-turn-helix domain-containing protein n=1 Tax=Nocardioides sp. TaxID=35761 RepID=UPI003219DE55
MNTNEKTLEALTSRLHEVMWRNRITQQQVAEVLGVTQTAVSKRLRGQTTLSLVEYLDMARCLGLSPVELLADVTGEVPKSAQAAAAEHLRNDGTPQEFLEGSYVDPRVRHQGLEPRTR